MLTENMYTVGNRNQSAAWRLGDALPGLVAGRLPRAVLPLSPKSVAVPMLQARNLILDDDTPGLHTSGAADCSVFAILHRSAGDTEWWRASLTHIVGGPDPKELRRLWESMVSRMDEDGDYYGILANRTESGLTEEFCDAVLDMGRVREENLWVYNAAAKGTKSEFSLDFGLDRSGHVGEV